ncbi:MAG: SDR family oxidoreductase [Phycisphaerales bacterium]|nr:SDR family oxidoreductase [Phycisphaerales bacterium]
MINLAGKTVVITGASSGIGAAAALAFAKRGAKLVLGARRTDKLTAVAEQAHALGADVIAHPCDVSHRDQVQALLQLAIEKFGRLDVAIANAGFGFVARVHETDEAQVDEIWRVNVLGTWYVMVEAANIMLPRKSGHVIAVSSAAARRSLPTMGFYSLTKAAQLSLVEAQRVELRGSGIKVSSVHPITTQTDFFDEASRRSRTRISGVGKSQTAELVGEKIARLAERPKPELWPFAPSRLALVFSSALPRLTDHMMAKMLPSRNKTD